MKQNNILFRMAARCEAAGRPNNEDNYQLDSDLSDDQWGFTADDEISLGNKGALLVVCDGMGGMNAGEVASDIAVKTIKQLFSTELLTDSVLANPCKYIADAIIKADIAIKTHSKEFPETEGMGSTIVMAWLLGQKVYIGWCGDSRCYRFNPQLGLERLSHDHSYVQELVDAGKLTEELAFDHPNNNIITRSLGDPRGEAQPDTKEFELYDQDIILLCSDGLCGTLRDNEIEEQIKLHQTSMQECRDALWEADKAAGWTDNVTIALAQILSGGKDVSIVDSKVSISQITTSKAELVKINKRLKRLLLSIIAIIVLIILVFCGYKYFPNFKKLLNLNNEEVVEEYMEEGKEEITLEEPKELEQKEKSDNDKVGKKEKKRNDSSVGNAAKGTEVQIVEERAVEAVDTTIQAQIN